MANETRQILIESILGGLSATSHFANEDQFISALGIDPALPVDDTGGTTSTGLVGASGLLRPSQFSKVSGTSITSAPMWMITTPKDTNIYIYDIVGSAYTYSSSGVFTGLSDGGSLSNSSANGCAYYDNYVYFAKQTTIARYGPLDGTPAFNGDYWVGTLGKAALTNTAYPLSAAFGSAISNHVMCRHSDGKLYIADVVGNQGVLHYIKTTKTTAEGDTDAGSVFNALDFGYGLWPTAIESYGSSIVIALYEGGNRQAAKIAFWDTTSDNFNSITWVEFPDPLITAIRNINGVLYIVSGQKSTQGFRITRYVGGSSFEEIFYSEFGYAPFQGAIDGDANRILFGSSLGGNSGVVYSLGLQKAALGQGLFTPIALVNTNEKVVTSLILNPLSTFAKKLPIVGWSDNTANDSDHNGVNAPSTTGQIGAIFKSRIFRIGRDFKITKITIPLIEGVDNDISITPTIYLDTSANSKTLVSIDTTNYPLDTRLIEIRPENCVGKFDFYLQLTWSGTNLLTVSLPIIIEYEIIKD